MLKVHFRNILNQYLSTLSKRPISRLIGHKAFRSSLLVFLHLGVFAISSGAPVHAQTELDLLYQQVQEKGQKEVVLLISSTDAGSKQLREAFQARFPALRIVTENNAGAPAQARMDGEFLSGKRTIDILMTGFEGFQPQLRKSRLVSYAPSTFSGLEERYRGADDAFHIFRTDIFPTVYSRKRVPEQASLPKDFNELLSNQWAGQFAFTNTGSADSLVGMVLSTWVDRGVLNWDQVQALASAGASRQNNLEHISQVAQGRLAFAMWCNGEYVQNLKSRGAPIDIHPAPFGTLFLEIGVGILQDAPNLEAAKLFTAWLFTDEAQRIIAQAWYPVLPGIDQPAYLPALPPDRPTMAELLTSAQKHRAEYERIFRD